MEKMLTMVRHTHHEANIAWKELGERHPRLLYALVLVGMPAAMLGAVSVSAAAMMTVVGLFMGWM